MKIFKRTAAFAISLFLVLTCFAGCHKKDEIAVKIGDYKFTSGYYCCALVYADTEARTKVDTELTDAGKSTEDVDYMKKKIDGKKYEEWVKQKAEDNVKINAGYKKLCADKGWELDDDMKSTAESYVTYYWDNYGYGEVFGKNGVSKETFTQYTKDTYYGQLYFEKTYGKDGEKAVSDEDVKKALTTHYVLADVLTTTLDGDAAETTKQEFENFKTQLESGTPFETVYNAFNGGGDATAEETVGEEDPAVATAEDGTAEETASAPKDSHAQLLGDSATDSESKDFEEISKMKIGEVKIIEKDKELNLYVRLDPLADPYYLETYEETLRKVAIGKDTPDNEAKAAAEKLGCEFVSSAVDRFKVKNIEYPEQTTTAY